MDVFNWQVSSATTVDTQISTVEAKFGDGYRQVGEDGINAEDNTVRVNVEPIELPEAQAIYDWLRAHRGQPFLWTPIKPLPQVESAWTSNQFSFKRIGGLIVGITATFRTFNMP